MAMVLVLWAVMLVLSAAAWFVQRPDRPASLRVALAIGQGGYLAWVAITQFERVGLGWLVVALTLMVAVSFRADPVQVFAGPSDS